MSQDDRVTPRTFYLNEHHELARTDKKGGGGIPKYVDINWASKGASINTSLQRARKRILASRDPSKQSHYFLLAEPVPRLSKSSHDKRHAVGGKVSEETNFGEKHSRVFRRLGIDLLNVGEDGSALVHMNPEIMDQLSNTARTLGELGDREKSRWATIGQFETIPPNFRIDADWLNTLRAKKITDVVVEFQPLLTRSEIGSLIRTIVSTLLQNLGEAITGTGIDFSGRQWVRGRITRESLIKISEDFFSVQALHSPLISMAASSPSLRQKSNAGSTSEIDVSSLPVIGVLDTGVPVDHKLLAMYRRGGYAALNSIPTDPHGSLVCSRIVFGDPDYDGGLPARTPAGTAAYYDINVGGGAPRAIDDKSIYRALDAVVSTAPDVRVFNLSFDDDPLDQILPVKRAESLYLVQDLDNFIFQNDIVVVVAAGNSKSGILPSPPYPGHFTDPRWGLGPWARSFNSLTCGSFVERPSVRGLVHEVGWPSPFCRVGPGLCDSPKPDFSSNGGNGNAQYQPMNGLGVWGVTDLGAWEDHAGTSFAAPLLARECGFALQRLQSVCIRGAQPFGVTVKSFLALTATPPVNDPRVRMLVDRTLGRGVASSRRLSFPVAGTGVMIWQGVLEDEKDIARIQIPIPDAWLREADEPYLRLIVGWDPPVNAAARQLWSTRNVTAKLRLHPDGPAQSASRVRSHRSYPLLDRQYDLSKLPPGQTIDGDTWMIEIAYDQIADYHPAMTFPPQQRVAFAAELFDRGTKQVSPQRSLQSLPVTKTMSHLTVPPAVARMPVVLKTPL